VWKVVPLAIAAVIVIGSIVTRPRVSVAVHAPLLAGAHIPQPVLATIQRSCVDCHSEATVYPWYSYVYPVSWLIRDDVTRGREHLNFSRWSEYPVVRRERCLSEIANQVQDGGMPLPQYTFVHRRARLSRSDVDAIFDWTQQERARLIAESMGR